MNKEKTAKASKYEIYYRALLKLIREKACPCYLCCYAKTRESLPELCKSCILAGEEGEGWKFFELAKEKVQTEAESDADWAYVEKDATAEALERARQAGWFKGKKREEEVMKIMLDCLAGNDSA